MFSPGPLDWGAGRSNFRSEVESLNPPHKGCFGRQDHQGDLLSVGVLFEAFSGSVAEVLVTGAGSSGILIKTRLLAYWIARPTRVIVFF